MRTFDLVVVGAGIGGGSLVYNLLRQGYRGSLLVVDRGAAVAQGATAYSAGGFRNLWTTPINQRLCTRAMEVLAGFREEMGLSIGFERSGYLFTYGADAWSRIPQAAEIWRANGVRFELLDPAAIEDRIPGLRCAVDGVDPDVREFLGMEPLVGGVLGLDCGSFDPSQAAAGYFARAAEFPVPPVLQFGTEALALRFGPGGKVTGIELERDGVREEVSTPRVALCTGPWTNRLLEASGCPPEERMPIASQKRMLFITDFPDADPRWPRIPLTVIDQGIYFKHESGNLMIGKADHGAPDSLDTTFDPDYYVEQVNLVMQERIPSTATCRLKSGWASLYDTCTADHNAILGWHDAHEGLLLQVGYSGHGAMESPAAGIALAELLLTGSYQTLDCSELAFSRFREGRTVHETIVI